MGREVSTMAIKKEWDVKKNPFTQFDTIGVASCATSVMGRICPFAGIGMRPGVGFGRGGGDILPIATSLAGRRRALTGILTRPPPPWRRYEVMLNCWEDKPLERPTFHDLKQTLDELLETAAGSDGADYLPLFS